MDFMNYDKENKQLEQDSAELGKDINEQSKNQAECSQKVDKLFDEINQLRESIGMKKLEFKEETTISDLNMCVEQAFPNNKIKTVSDRELKMRPMDYIVSALTGGLAAIIDVFLVKIPKDAVVVRNGERIF